MTSLIEFLDRLHTELSRVSCRVEGTLRSMKLLASQLLEEMRSVAEIAKAADIPDEAVLLHASQLVPTLRSLARQAEMLRQDLEKAKTSYREPAEELARGLGELAREVDFEVRDCMAKYVETRSGSVLRACIQNVVSKLEKRLSEISYRAEARLLRV